MALPSLFRPFPAVTAAANRVKLPAFLLALFWGFTTPAMAACPALTTTPAKLMAISCLTDAQNKPENLSLSLNNDLGVVLNTASSVDASTFVLFLNGRAVDGLDPIYDASNHRIVFHLQRTPANAADWQTLLGAPTGLSKAVAVSLGVRTTTSPHPQPTVVGINGIEPSFHFQTIPMIRFALATLAIGVMLLLVWGSATRTTILKDNLIPQIEPKRQPYSLGRWQMAVWFSLVFASYVFLFILLNDPNTLSEQALMLMGISGGTALAAVTVDAAKDSPSHAANAGLQLLGIKSWTDVVRIKAEIFDREAQLASKNVPLAKEAAAQLTLEILDRRMKLRTYEEAITPFVSGGWFADIATDLNGPALHRIQVICWTFLLGGIFLYGVWHDLAMPQFSYTLLALMGISSAGYIGFKYPESQ